MTLEVEARFNLLENIVLNRAESVQSNQAETAELKAIIAADRQASQAQMAELSEVHVCQGASTISRIYADWRSFLMFICLKPICTLNNL